MTYEKEVDASENEEGPGRDLRKERDVVGKDSCGDAEREGEEKLGGLGKHVIAEGTHKHCAKPRNPRPKAGPRGGRKLENPSQIRLTVDDGVWSSPLVEDSDEARATDFAEEENDADEENDDSVEDGEEGTPSLLWG